MTATKTTSLPAFKATHGTIKAARAAHPDAMTPGGKPPARWADMFAAVAARAADVAAAAAAARETAAAAIPVAPMPPTEGTRAPVAVSALRCPLDVSAKEAGLALAEIVGPRGPFVKGKPSGASFTTGTAARDYRVAMLATLRDTVMALPVADGPLPPGAIGHAVTKPGGHPGHVLTGPDAEPVAVMPSRSIGAAASIGYDVTPRVPSADGKRAVRAATALYAFTRPGKGDKPAAVVTLSGYTVEDTVAAIGAARVGKRGGVRKTALEVIDLGKACRVDGIIGAAADVKAALDALAGHDAVKANPDGAAAIRREQETSATAGAGDKATRDGAAALLSRRYQTRRRRAGDALQRIGKATRTVKAARKGGKAGKAA